MSVFAQGQIQSNIVGSTLCKSQLPVILNREREREKDRERTRERENKRERERDRETERE